MDAWDPSQTFLLRRGVSTMARTIRVSDLPRKTCTNGCTKKIKDAIKLGGLNNVEVKREPTARQVEERGCSPLDEIHILMLSISMRSRRGSTKNWSKSKEEVLMAYFQEAKWYYNKKKIPRMEQYMKNEIPSCSYLLLATTSWLAMGNITTKDSFDWIAVQHLLLCTITRLLNDLSSHEKKKTHFLRAHREVSVSSELTREVARLFLSKRFGKACFYMVSLYRTKTIPTLSRRNVDLSKNKNIFQSMFRLHFQVETLCILELCDTADDAWGRWKGFPYNIREQICNKFKTKCVWQSYYEKKINSIFEKNARIQLKGAEVSNPEVFEETHKKKIRMVQGENGGATCRGDIYKL
uniref:Terpene synthase metal-binding domain-containing protein n=1 Tax=Solanum lycopersicum TaxID=4081 RepID=A0A3Q7IGV8_SOLLC